MTGRNGIREFVTHAHKLSLRISSVHFLPVDTELHEEDILPKLKQIYNSGIILQGIEKNAWSSDNDDLKKQKVKRENSTCTSYSPFTAFGKLSAFYLPRST